MRILVQGDINRLQKIKKFECGDCGCVFVGNREEYEDCSTQRDGAWFTMECPCCGRTVHNTTYEVFSHKHVFDEEKIKGAVNDKAEDHKE